MCQVADRRILELEASRDLSRIWLQVDMDAAVETLSSPTLKGRPMAVGSMSMISTANYEAKKFGVRSAMPGFIARELCPELIFVPTDFKKYNYYSDLTRKSCLPITSVDVTYDGKWVLGTTDTYLVLICTLFTDKDGKTKTGFGGRMGNRIPAPRLLKLTPLDSHLAGTSNKFHGGHFSYMD